MKLFMERCARCNMMSLQWKTTLLRISVPWTSVLLMLLLATYTLAFSPGAMAMFHQIKSAPLLNWSSARPSNPRSRVSCFCFMKKLPGRGSSSIETLNLLND